MASSDVIELGSSDDEAEHVPKKKKPSPNAMVQFPKGVMTTANPGIPNLQKVIAGGSVTITNVKKNKVQVNKPKSNGKFLQSIVPNIPVKVPIVKHSPLLNIKGFKSNLSVNPLSLNRNAPNVKVQTPKVYLPPGITVKRTAVGQKVIPNVSITRKRQHIAKKPKIITTVELDDEEVPLTSETKPQWYLRPEQNQQPVKHDCEIKDKQINAVAMETESTIEMKNNEEPDTSKYIEITIEDSPIKPNSIRKGFEIGTQLAITIEDSPVKLAIEQPCSSGSDSEKSQSTSERHSKKKLDYPKGQEESITTDKETPNIIEIDLDIVPSADSSRDIRMNDEENITRETKKKSEIQEVKTIRREQTVFMGKEVKNSEKADIHVNDSSEFQPVYQNFIDLCFKLENSDDMNKIVEKKIKTYYRQSPKEYVESEEFTDMVSSKILAMKAAPDKMYLYIKDIVDELNLQRKNTKPSSNSNKDSKNEETEKYFEADESIYDSKKQKQIRKLEKTIKKLHRAIQKLEEQEVEFDDEEDSVYLLTERYKERLIRVHAKFCQLTKKKMPSEPRIQIEARPGQPTGPAKRLEKWINKKVPIGTPLPFPDFHDVLRCVRDANEEDRLGWNEADIMEEARDLFTRCGKKLQRRRQENEWRIAVSRISNDFSTLDPAEDSDVLKKRLEENKTLAAKKELELLNKYADRQNQLKLVGEEIGDKEADESPVESEDDDVNDGSNSLEDKQKRKERLKRLLHEKTRKLSTEKENIPTAESKENNVETNVTEKDEIKECVSSKKVTESSKIEKINDTAKETEDNTLVVNDDSSSYNENAPCNDSSKDSSKEFNMYDVDSDIDELHLLQKLYSENEINSSTQESDSDSPIAISDNLDSDTENEKVKKQQNDDIISIENSSYSESEITQDDLMELKPESKNIKRTENLLLGHVEIEMSSKTSSQHLTEHDENILLASSDEENDNGDTQVRKNTLNDINISCKARLKGNIIPNNNGIVEVILDNSEENSVESNVTEEGISVSKTTKPNDMVVNDFEMISSNEDQDKNKDVIGLKERDAESVESMSTEVMSSEDMIEKNDIDNTTISSAVISKEKVPSNEDHVHNKAECLKETHIERDDLVSSDKIIENNELHDTTISNAAISNKMVAGSEDQVYNKDEFSLKKSVTLKNESMGADDIIQSSISTIKNTFFNKKHVAEDENIDKIHDIDDGGNEKNIITNSECSSSKRDMNKESNVTSVNHNLQTQKPIGFHDISEENNGNAGDCVKISFTEQDLNKCEVTDSVNVNITGANSSDSLSNQLSEMDVDVSSDQCT